MKVIQFIQHVFASTFIGIGVYGILKYWDYKPGDIDAPTSLFWGGIAIICVIGVCLTGMELDKRMSKKGGKREED